MGFKSRKIILNLMMEKNRKNTPLFRDPEIPDWGVIDVRSWWCTARLAYQQIWENGRRSLHRSLLAFCFPLYRHFTQQDLLPFIPSLPLSLLLLFASPDTRYHLLLSYLILHTSLSLTLFSPPPLLRLPVSISFVFPTLNPYPLHSPHCLLLI